MLINNYDKVIFFIHLSKFLVRTEILYKKKNIFTRKT